MRIINIIVAIWFAIAIFGNLRLIGTDQFDLWVFLIIVVIETILVANLLRKKSDSMPKE